MVMVTTLILSILLLLVLLCEGYTRVFRLSSLSSQPLLVSSTSLLSTTTNTNTNIDTDATTITNDDDNGSVHLQLTGKLDHRIDDDTNSTSKKHIVPILEFYNNDDNKTIIASAENIGIQELELFSMYLFNHNYSMKTGVSLRARNLNVREKEDKDFLMTLWQSERLLAASRNFPYNFISEVDNDSFKSTFMSHLKRIQTVKDGIKDGDDVIYSFIKNQCNISGMNWDHYIFNPNDSKDVVLGLLKNFSVWFKQQFPYYYDNCLSCGNARTNMWYGSVYPSTMERAYRAGKTELYSCTQCNCTSRFPRFNEVQKVLETKRGRCGEYSILIFRMLKVLGYNVRYIADWADHVWVEAKVQNDWIHIDPCEAAVNEPLIYQGWGKNQTYIFSFSFDDTEDVTQFYTTNYNATLMRREADKVDDKTIQETLLEARGILTAVSNTDNPLHK